MSVTVTESDVRELVSPACAFDCTKRAHIALALGRAANVVRSRARTAEASIHVLEAASSELGLGGAKVYAAGRGGMQSHFLLYRLETCELLALIEANELGRLRTAAASAVAASVLSPGLSAVVAIVGSGYQAEGLARSFSDPSSGVSVTKLLLAGRSAEHAARLAGLLSASLACPIESGTPDQLLPAAQIIITATSAAKPVISEDVLSSCRLLCAVGSNSLARAELPPRAVTGARSVVLDSVEAAKAEGGNLLAPVEHGKLLWQQCLELGDLLARVRSLPADSSPAAPNYNLFCSHGLAVQDLYLAALVYERFRSVG